MPPPADPVLRRKLRAAVDARTQGRVDAAILARAAGRAAMTAPGCHAGLGALDERRLDLDALADAVAGPGLRHPLRAAAGTAEPGLAWLDAGLTDALIWVAVTGAPPPGDRRTAPDRAPTALDAALCAGFLAALLAEIGGLGGPWAGFADRHPGPAEPDLHALRLALPRGQYRCLLAELRLGDDPGTGGALLLALPETGVAGQPAAVAAPPAGRVAPVLAAAPLGLRAVLLRQPFTLAALRALAPGDRIDLPPGADRAVLLETAQGVAVARARLGQARGHRAVLLGEAAPPADTP